VLALREDLRFPIARAVAPFAILVAMTVALPARAETAPCLRLSEVPDRGFWAGLSPDQLGLLEKLNRRLLIVERFDFESRPPWRSRAALERGILPPADPGR